nr:peptidylprolyl isomerase [Niveispirillum irakense]
MAVQAADKEPPLKPENTLYLDLKDGRVVIAMRPDVAPLHVARIRQLVRRGFYDGLTFHRVVKGFIAQTGDPLGRGIGGSGRYLLLEPSDLPHERGTVSMARGLHKNSGDSQFFILMRKERSLDGQYTIWGKVIEGMDLIDRLKVGDPARNDLVNDPDRIIKASIGGDPEKPAPPAAPAKTTPGK